MKDENEGRGVPTITIPADSGGLGEGQTYTQRDTKKTKTDEHIIIWELTVLIFCIMITKEVPQRKGGCEAGGEKKRERK